MRINDVLRSIEMERYGNYMEPQPCKNKQYLIGFARCICAMRLLNVFAVFADTVIEMLTKLRLFHPLCTHVIRKNIARHIL